MPSFYLILECITFNQEFFFFHIGVQCFQKFTLVYNISKNWKIAQMLIGLKYNDTRKKINFRCYANRRYFEKKFVFLAHMMTYEVMK